MSRITMAGTAVLAATMLLLQPPAAQADAVPEPEPLVTTGEVAVDTFTADGSQSLSRRLYGPETAGKLMADGPTQVAAKSGSLSTAGSASGCRRVTITNRGSTWLGATAYEFNTWTYWCWTRSTQVTTNISVGWSISDVDSQYYWQGVVNTELDRYDYGTNDGHPYSAFKHYRQGRFDNCVLKYGCLGSVYPANTLRSYYDGTWSWNTEG